MTSLTLWILVGLFIAVFFIPLPGRSASTADRVTDTGVRRTFAARSALGWVVLFFAFHVYWYCGGSFASPGELPPLSTPNRVEAAAGMHAFVSWVLNAAIELAWPVGALVCLTIVRGRVSGRIARVVQALAWLGCVLLLLRGVSGLVDDVTRATGLLPNGITGLSLKDTTGHAHLQWSGWVIDGYFLLGGVAFWLLAFRHHPQRQTHARIRRVDEPAAHRSTVEPAVESLAQRPVPGWARHLAHSIPLMVLPSGLWRWAVAFGFPMGMVNSSGQMQVGRGWPAVYIAVISLFSEAVALTAFGLVRPLGEEVPRWLPFVGGRSVRPNAVIVAATVGSVALILIWTVGFWNVWTGGRPGPMVSSFWVAVFTACYAPLNLWGPALLVLTWSYHRRRADPSGSMSGRKRSMTAARVTDEENASSQG